MNRCENCLTDRQQKIILIPYAEKNSANTGVNISKYGRRQEIYMKNCCVSACSAKYNNENSDVAIVTNIEFPERYAHLLKEHGVMIIKVPYDMFCFGDTYIWSLAFYKLCALYHVVREFDYMYYAYLDADVYVQAPFDDIWTECNYNIMLYDISHGLQVKDYRILVEEVEAFLGSKRPLTHFGGEFFAANKENAIRFSERCLSIYTQMYAVGFETTKGDEFIISIAADEMKDVVKNASAYIYRFWTGAFRLVSTCYQFNPVTILHVPAEKEKGVIQLFDKYFCKGKKPSDSVVHKLLHLQRQSLKLQIALRIKGILKHIMRR